MRASQLIRASMLPRFEAERLLVAATMLTRARLVGDPEIADPAADRFLGLAIRRRRGEPLQYLEGTVQFGPIELVVDRSVLIPRSETEQLYELAVEMLRDIADPVVVDLCTGSGNLALAVKHARPDATVHATDISRQALATARGNAERLGLDVSFHLGDTFGPLPGRLRGTIDLVLANPPYLGVAEMATLPRDVRDHEPHVALLAGPTGDEVLVKIASGLGTWLAQEGRIICEISEFRSERARELFHGATIRRDLAGKPRFLMAQRPGHEPRDST